MGTWNEWLRYELCQNLRSRREQSILTMIDASTTRSPEASFSSKSGLTTPQGAPFFDIAAVPTGWAPELVLLMMKSFKSASVVAFTRPPDGPTKTASHTGAERKRRKPCIASRATKRSNSDAK
jgi:hypothetical protein